MERIAAAARRAGRRPDEVTLLVSTKGRSLAEIDEAIRAGVRIVGENRVQEAETKYPHLMGRVRLHMIGHLQRNKVKEALRIFDMIHSVDSLRLAEEIEKAGGRMGKIVPVLLEVNVSGEESKFGVRPEGIRPMLERISRMKAVRVEGLMTMSPLADDPEKSRPIFRRLKELASEIAGEEFSGVAMDRLSMGMTQDFEAAVEEGATIVRVGTAIFH
jgi:pyridoxal phosphate enzyme (YggS family)